ncbi:uclacyanin 1 [Elaeis guineensis]|uniref:Uclacyanin 1 n=1 Tax=Elaeis guineensis var. tenera TaxID=51953 RepID=A0A6I9RS05_ELAGV|nr:uclacyanin 1 [Elaeis guineensis]
MLALRAFIGVATIAALVQVAIGASFPVGGQNGGWDLSTNLASWAATQKFIAGDSLTFKYASFHDVLEVSKAEYDACATSKPTNTYTGGSTVVKLSSPGKRYFICGTPGHCSQGMKVEIDVVSAATATPPTAAPASPPLPMSSPPTEAPKSSKPSKAAPSKAPSSSPATISPSPEPSASDLPATTTSPAPPPRSAANGLGQDIKVAMGFGVGMLLVLSL